MKCFKAQVSTGEVQALTGEQLTASTAVQQYAVHAKPLVQGICGVVLGFFLTMCAHTSLTQKSSLLSRKAWRRITRLAAHTVGMHH